MKRLVVALLAVALTAGCAPAGADGDLVNGWPAMPAASVREPAVGDCWVGTALTSDGLTQTPSCDDSHTAETVVVGKFGPTEAAGTAPPRGASLREAFAACDKGATDLLGEEWRDARLDLLVFAPTVKLWAAGSRSYRCDLIERKSESGDAADRKGSVKDGLRGDKPLARGCAQILLKADKTTDDFIHVACIVAHGAEYASAFIAADGPVPADGSKSQKEIDAGCDIAAAKFVGLSTSEFDAQSQYSYTWWWASDDGWIEGNRGVRCYLTLTDGKTVTRSLKGNGKQPL